MLINYNVVLVLRVAGDSPSDTVNRLLRLHLHVRGVSTDTSIVDHVSLVTFLVNRAHGIVGP